MISDEFRQRVMGNAVHDKGDDQGKRPLVKTLGTQTRHGIFQ